MTTTFEHLSHAIGHDPAIAANRSPLGAVAAGERVRLSVRVVGWATSRVREVVLVTRVFGDLGSSRACLIPERDGTGDVWFSCELSTAGDPRVVLYRFELTLEDGRVAILAPQADGRSTAGELYLVGAGDTCANSRGEVLGEPDGWFQVTIHDPAFTTPSWLEGAVMYQIFPDRFARSHGDAAARALSRGIAAHERRGRPVKLHTSWDELPCWRDETPGHVDVEGVRRYDPVDFFGGTLRGIEERLDYLASLGVGVVYLNPVFEARSNHRYDTADYSHVDPILGTDADLGRLARAARSHGIRLVLDAVLSHTGDDSVYFNRAESYPDAGAWQAHAQGAVSPYASWYDFSTPCELAPYRCWWGEPTLPEVEERDPSWQRLMLGVGAGRCAGEVRGEGAGEDGTAGAGENGILPTWLSRGASGYRLDVADELPDDVLEKVRTSVKGADVEAAIIGEVWEDPTRKESYGVARSYALGRALDSVMNYPLRDALIGFALGTRDAFQLVTLLKHQLLDYPAPMHRCLMNLLSTHDVERVRTLLAVGHPIKGLPRAEQLRIVGSISEETDARACELQTLIATLLYAIPGMPCLYYGDEIGMHGGGDPFCRATFPEVEGDTAGAGKAGSTCTPRFDCGRDLTGLYRELGTLRKGCAALRHGETAYFAPSSDVVCVLRMTGKEVVIAAANRADTSRKIGLDLLSSGSGLGADGSRLLSDMLARASEFGDPVGGSGSEAEAGAEADAGTTADFDLANGIFRFTLAARQARIFRIA